jgi:hypothetical protein
MLAAARALRYMTTQRRRPDGDRILTGILRQPLPLNEMPAHGPLHDLAQARIRRALTAASVTCSR